MNTDLPIFRSEFTGKLTCVRLMHCEKAKSLISSKAWGSVMDSSASQLLNVPFGRIFMDAGSVTSVSALQLSSRWFPSSTALSGISIFSSA